MNTPLTDKLIQDLAIRELESERTGVTTPCKFDEIVEFARTLESELNEKNHKPQMKETTKKNHQKYGVHSRKNLDDCKNLLLGLAIGGAGLILALVIELI